MKVVAAVAALSVLIVLPAQAGQRHRQNNVSPSCDNDGRCATLQHDRAHIERRAPHTHIRA